MIYAPFADECTIAQMCAEWHVEYETMRRIVRLAGLRPVRRVYNTGYFSREQQAQLAKDTLVYMQAPRFLPLERESAGGDPETRNVSSQVQLKERCAVAEARVKRLMDMVQADQDEITQLRAERSTLQAEIDGLRVQLYALMSDDDALLTLRLLPTCARLTAMDLDEYAAFQASVVDDTSAVVLLTGALRLLGAALDGACRQNDARLLAGADVMVVAQALSTTAEVGRIADARLDQYDAMAQAILAKDADIRTPEEVRP